MVVDETAAMMEAVISHGQQEEEIMRGLEDDENDDDDDLQVPWLRPDRRLQRPLQQSVPELLALRQGYGVSPLALPPFARPRTIMTSTLAFKIAW
jgi:hypothetical protein